jgi:transposase
VSFSFEGSNVKEEDLAAYVGLDWADQRHAVCLQAANCSELETFEVEQKPEALHAWVAHMRSRFDGGKVAIALEQSRGALIHALMAYEFLIIYPINPKSLARYREAFASSGAKDDPPDARFLLDFVKLHRDRLKAWVPDDVQTRTIQLLTEERRKLVNDRAGLMNRTTSLLKGYFPQALDWAGSLDTIQACDFLLKWNTLAAVQKIRPAQLRQFYYAHRCRSKKLIDERIDQIGTARHLTEDSAILTSQSMTVRATVAQLKTLTESIDEFDRVLAELFAQHPDHDLFDSFPGAGKALAPRLLAAMGADRGRWDEALDVQRLSGIAPVTVKSGKSCWVHQRWACPKFLKQTFHEFAAKSILYCDWASAYYHQQRQRGKEHHAAVRALAYKWIRIIFRCWMNREVYDEKVYLDALRRRASTLLARVEVPA